MIEISFTLFCNSFETHTKKLSRYVNYKNCKMLTSLRAGDPHRKPEIKKNTECGMTRTLLLKRPSHGKWYDTHTVVKETVSQKLV